LRDTAKNKISDELINQFVLWCSGFLPSIEFENLIYAFEKEFSRFYFGREIESNVIRIINAIIDKVSFLSDCLNYPHHVEIICSIAANSNYLTDILVRNPELFYQIFSPQYLKSTVDKKTLSQEIENGVSRYKTLDAKVKYLRSYKRRYLLKIGLNDILGNTTLKQVTENISILAETINSQLFFLCYNQILSDYKLEKVTSNYCLMSLGKQGGNELNYSSDIDLLLIYDNEESFGQTTPLYYYEIINECTKLFVKKSTEFTELGNLYRVDFRLRPDGNAAPIARTLLDTMNYYESRGEQWEKQMLIKLSYIGGSKELFSRFQSFVHSYVYSSSMQGSPLETINVMKKNIEKHYNDSQNVKTTIGGIRDIEFSVQALQLLNGGKFKILRTGNTIEALENLHSLNLISQHEYETFVNAYIFYRKIEHYLQLMNNLQTHTLPANVQVQLQLSYFLKYSNYKNLIAEFNNSRKKVRAIFNSIINPGKNNSANVSPTESHINFLDPKRANKNLEFLEFGSGLITQKNFDSKTTLLFQKIKPLLLQLLKRSISPDTILNNYVKIVQVYKYIAILYKELQNEKFHKGFIRICEYSQYSINLMLNSPTLVEDLISRKVFVKNIPARFADSKIENILLMLSIQYTLNLIDHSKLSANLTAFITFVIQKRYAEEEINLTIFIAGLGSFGVQDMTLKSDLDLIVVTNDISKHENIQEVFQIFLSKIRRELKPIEVDFRLRPEGKSSPLVWDINNYKIYLQKRAGIWEYQSLIKSRFVCGDKILYKSFQNIVKSNAQSLPKKLIRDNVKEMHKKITTSNLGFGIPALNIKSSLGGLVTVDYIVTYLYLIYNFENTMFRETKTKKILLQKIVQEIPSSGKILENYNLLKSVLLKIQLAFDTNKTVIPSESLKLNLLNDWMKFEKSKLIEKNILEVFKTNFELYNKILREY
jgi:glutamate-ammonia-ligase adenylyltransferase